MLHSAPYTSPSFQIILVPPIEDEEPDSLLFNSDQRDLATPPHFASLDDALARLHSDTNTPQFDRTALESVVLPKRSQPDLNVADETVRDDSEIVEVVKVRRAYQEAEQPTVQTKPKPKSLRSRAGSAFRSIKNLARATTRSASHNRPYAQDVFASSQSTQATFSTVPVTGTSPPLTRRGSIILADLFRTPSRSSCYEPPTTERYSDELDDSDDPRRPPEHRASCTFPFSVCPELYNQHTPPPVHPQLPSKDNQPAAAPFAPDPTPTDEIYPHSPPSAKEIADDPDRTVGEMRLDSLHFEAMSFDADQF
ncbi:hypothetical protein C8F01DRAFT_1250655 [Mycena amicta]|nr:hypothetical protein C8F01DRAFT_1250655 [Mycena amicta]